MPDQSTTTARTLAIFPLTEIDRTNTLLADYLLNEASAHDLFAHTPEEMLDLARSNRAQADRARLSAALLAFQEHLGADDAAKASARLLADPETPVVSVGQQAGLLTGPLYTIYKAMSAINVANRLAGDLGRIVVPVFWTSTDDDDRSEADHCGLWDQQGALRAVHYPDAAGTPGQLIGNLPLNEYGQMVLQQVEPLLDGLPFAAEARATLRETLAESADMGEWFCRLMARLFSPLGLVLCDPRLPEMRRLAAEVLCREVRDPLATTVAVNNRARALQSQGYRPQLTKPADVCNFFYLDETRHRVAYRDERFHIQDRVYTPAELLAQIEAHPESFVPNAVLRPVAQEYLLGSSAFIAGPNELGYWAELAPVFDAMGVAMPPVVPRAGATLVPAPVAREIHQWHVNPLQLLFAYDQVRFDLLEDRQPEAVTAGFAASRITVERLIADLVPLVSSVDATLEKSTLATHQRMLNELERLERKTLKAVERQSADQMARLEHVRKVLFPRKGPQERVLNVFSLIARYGPDVLNQLRVLIDREEGRHLFVEV